MAPGMMPPMLAPSGEAGPAPPAPATSAAAQTNAIGSGTEGSNSMPAGEASAASTSSATANEGLSGGELVTVTVSNCISTVSIGGKFSPSPLQTKSHILPGAAVLSNPGESAQIMTMTMMATETVTQNSGATQAAPSANQPAGQAPPPEANTITSAEAGAKSDAPMKGKTETATEAAKATPAAPNAEAPSAKSGAEAPKAAASKPAAPNEEIPKAEGSTMTVCFHILLYCPVLERPSV
jgi:hypothetical protein